MVKSKISVRTLALVFLAIFTTAFAFMNYSQPVPVWPFGRHPLTVVIAVAFVLGVGVGALGQSILGLFRTRAHRLPEGEAPLQAGQRDHPGRP